MQGAFQIYTLHKFLSTIDLENIKKYQNGSKLCEIWSKVFKRDLKTVSLKTNETFKNDRQNCTDWWLFKIDCRQGKKQARTYGEISTYLRSLVGQRINLVDHLYWCQHWVGQYSNMVCVFQTILKNELKEKLGSHSNK